MKLHYMALEIGTGRACQLHHFACATDAEEGARMIARLSRGVVAFQQWREGELWRSPEVLVSYGDVPPDALGDPSEVAA